MSHLGNYKQSHKQNLAITQFNSLSLSLCNVIVIKRKRQWDEIALYLDTTFEVPISYINTDRHAFSNYQAPFII